ncbi:sarcosine oxidase subunit beta family protein [Leisingera daeponensis]|uniref:sarcosine oxidase subunit beta family protein n=1 Tax=Leisingera daeponensis TaxID=405746 RepID=UPI001C972705|nr:sarcosine oxidase subunit beta family protein [Leisingera daeponensis]MBY6058065.1 sarcosine oxidase subunit beta family protein [Leisingera daeponensis]
MQYSITSLVKQALRGHQGWPEAFRHPEPRKQYDVVIIGGGGHGLATAYYLAKNHGITNVAVLEKGWIGSGNTGRNTTIVRSNYLLNSEIPLLEWSLKLWEGLSEELNYNVMFSQRGVLDIFHTDGQRDEAVRRGNAMIMNGVDAVMLDRRQVLEMMPLVDENNGRFPVLGGLLQPRAGNARHDAVVWGYARAADRLGVDIIQNCEVTGFERDANGRMTGVETTRGRIGAGKVAVAVAGHTSQVMQKAGIRLPVESHKLQAFVSEAVKPCVDTVATFGVGHLYISQSDKGGLVFGGMLDGYNSFAQRGNLPIVEDVAEAMMMFLPSLGRVRLLRHWAGVVDMTMDGSPYICKTPVEGLYLNGGWNYTGFKAIPGAAWCFAHTVANDAPHKYNAPFHLGRFAEGRPVDATGGGPFPNQH